MTNEKINWEKVSVKEMFKGLEHLKHLISCKFDEMWHFTFYNRWPLDILQYYNWIILSTKIHIFMMNVFLQKKSINRQESLPLIQILGVMMLQKAGLGLHRQMSVVSSWWAGAETGKLPARGNQWHGGGDRDILPRLINWVATSQWAETRVYLVGS